MMDYKEILEKTREGEFKWVIEMYKPSMRHKPTPLSESSLTDHLANYSNKFANVSSFLAWGNDPRMIDGSILPYGLLEMYLTEDDRTFNQITPFSEYYKGYAPKEHQIIPTARLEKFMGEIDKRTADLNAVIPSTKHPNSDRDFVAKKFVEFASLVALSEKTLENATLDVQPYVDMIYSYKTGKIFVTNPCYHDKIPKDKRHLFGLI